MKTLRYETRDADGNDIVKDVAVKEFASADAEFRCHVCGGNAARALERRILSRAHLRTTRSSGIMYAMTAQTFLACTFTATSKTLTG